MDKKFTAIGIVAILIVIGLYVSWGQLGAVYILEGGGIEFSENNIIITGSGVPQSYNAFTDGGTIQITTGTDAPADLEEYVVSGIDMVFSFGSCGYGSPQSATLVRGNIPGEPNDKVFANVAVPSIRAYWEPGQVMEVSPWTFTCARDSLPQMNPPMQVSGTVTFTNPNIQPPNPCDGVTCNPITRTCEDGYVATCQTSCSEGVCSSCQPDCTGHGSGPGPVTPDINPVSVIILAIIFIGIFAFIGFKVWGWKR